ncbi:MAG: hemolysin family protein [Blautia sp.]|nr:hemolysin family protein [Blautia sp.]MDY3999184.1 hemolysin family protein [Blautia sp.]
MDSSVPIQALLVLILVLLSAFFSSAETAMTTVNRIRVQSLVEQGNKRAVILDKVISDSSKMLSTILIGNNIVNMAASSLMTTLTIKVLGNVYVGLATGFLTLLILIFGEITPKTLASIHSEKLSLSYARVIYFLMIILTPVVYIIGKLSNGVMFLLRVDPDAKHNTMTEHELRTLVNVSQEDGVIESEEKQMIYNVFDFGDSTAKDVMIPRIDMTFINISSTFEELIDIFREDMHTRFPVYEDNTDNVIGIINIKDLLLYPKDKPFSIREILREPYFTYEYKSTADLMLEMRKASVNLAIVLDEYGATAGLVTLEDLLEEIVGEIRDEYDEDEEEPIKEIQPGIEYTALGSAKLDDINDVLQINLTSEDYDSIGGYIIEQLDCLPGHGQSVTTDSGIRLVVDDIDKNRIELVHIWLPEKEQAAQEDEHR